MSYLRKTKSQTTNSYIERNDHQRNSSIEAVHESVFSSELLIGASLSLSLNLITPPVTSID